MAQAPTLKGPEDQTGPGLKPLAEGVWITSGRAAVVEGPDHLVVVDPGDEPVGFESRPAGPLADALELARRTAKPLGWILVTHAHPDHVANLNRFRKVGPLKVVAHARSPVLADVAIEERVRLEIGGRVEALPTPGHSAWGDDLSFWCPRSGVLFSGDLVQPKGETWEEPFYPSPYPYCTDGAVYTASLEILLALPFETLVTGHREVRVGKAGRGWVELTLRAIRRVEESVAAWSGSHQLAAAGPAIFRNLSRERRIPDTVIEDRLTRQGDQPSAFELFDLPCIAFYWERLRSGATP